MANNEHSIRVSARGEFGQLERGLKNLQRDLKSVLGEIDKGARRGGLFDETQLRALDVYRSRFKTSMDEINRELHKQNDAIEQLHRRRQNSAHDEHRAIDEEIRRREKSLDVLRRQLRTVEDLYRARNKEAQTYRTMQTQSPSMMTAGGAPASAGGGIAGMAMMKALGMGKFMMGLAGVGGIASMASQAYQQAYASQVTPMNLSQRLRGAGHYGGSAKGMWDTIGNVGRNDSMGYTSAESWQFMDMYSRQAGSINPFQLESLMKFGRGYGLEVGETAQSMASVRELGGATSPEAFASMIAASVDRSGMTPRILEVMETSAGLLEQMNVSLKDGGAKEILAYQTVLDALGNKNGMMRLTGQQGANLIGGLGGIYNPGQNNDWKWMGIQALQQYNPGKYGKMGLYDLEASFEDGLTNTDNIPAMAQYMREKSGGNETTMKRMLQRWLQDGGYNATKRHVDDLYGVTDGFTAFDKGKMDAVLKDLESGDATGKYQERMGQLGQDILDTNARFEKQLENLGQPILATVQGMKEGLTSILEEITSNSMEGTLDDIKKFMEDNLKGLATAAGLALLAPAIAKLLPKSGGSGAGKDEDGKEGNTREERNSNKNKPSVVPLAGLGALGRLVLGGASIFAGKQSFDAFNSEARGKHRAAADAAGYDGEISWFDRVMGESAEALGMNLETFYGLFSNDNKQKQERRMNTFFATLFPDTFNVPSTKENAEAVKRAADPENKNMQWYEYANPTKWGDIKLPESWGKNFSDMKDGFLNVVNETFGWDLGGEKKEAAISSLVNLGSTGTVNIAGMSEIGKAKIQQLADEGLLKLEEGKTAQTTMLTGFTEEGKSKLQALASEGLISIGGFTTDGSAKLTVLSDEGRLKLDKLKEDGLINIGKFKDEGTLNITNLSKEGAKSLIDLEKNGSISMTSMDITTSKELEEVRKKTNIRMDDIHGEHQSFFEKTVGKDGVFTKWADGFGKLWDKFIDAMKSLLPSWLGGEGNSTIGSFSGQYEGKYSDVINKAAKQYGVDPYLIASVIGQESGFNPNATSHAGAMGLMQLMPGTARGLGVTNAYDPEQNVMGGTKHLARLIKKYDGNVEYALYAYNAGEGNVDKWIKQGQMGNIPYKETANYAPSVMKKYQEYMKKMGGGGNFFDGWQKRVTSHYGENRGGYNHGGLDIDGNQGDALQALYGGKIKFIHYDDGSKRDKDGKKNTRAGGTEIGVQMANGETYFYSHLSNVASGLKVGDKVSAGQFIGNVGGDKGMPGSGYSTTGSHLHLGYLSQSGHYKDPTALLRALSQGNSDIGMWQTSGTSVKRVEVAVSLEGEGASKLNQMTAANIQKIVEQAIKNYTAQQLLLNPNR